MTFPYIKVPVDPPSTYFGNSLLKPIIPIGLSFSNKRIKYGALLDTGADFCIFNGVIGDYLGIDVRNGLKEPFGGIQKTAGRKAVAFIHRVVLTIGGIDLQTNIGFSYDIAPWGYGVLGQRGFFDLFVVIFNYEKETIELKQKRKR